jgi:hypothetical protein
MICIRSAPAADIVTVRVADGEPGRDGAWDVVRRPLVVCVRVRDAVPDAVQLTVTEVLRVASEKPPLVMDAVPDADKDADPTVDPEAVPDADLDAECSQRNTFMLCRAASTGVMTSCDVVLFTNAVVSVNATLSSLAEAELRAVRLSHATSGVCPSRQWYKTMLLATMRSAPGEASCWLEPTVAPMHVPAHTSVAPNVSENVVAFANCVDP